MTLVSFHQSCPSEDFPTPWFRLTQLWEWLLNVHTAQRGCRNVINGHTWQPLNSHLSALLLPQFSIQGHCNSKGFSHRKWLIEVNPTRVNLEFTLGFSSGLNERCLLPEPLTLNVCSLAEVLGWTNRHTVLREHTIRLGLLMTKAERCWHYMTKPKYIIHY